MTNKQDFNKRHKQPANESNKIQEVSKLSGIKLSILEDVYDRGLGAHRSNPGSVRTKSGAKDPKAPMSKKMSKEQWGMARVYSFVNKVEGKKKLNHDLDLAKKIK